MPRRVLPIMLMAMMSLALAGCAHRIYPVTTGSHSPAELTSAKGPYVVWSNHAGVDHFITSMLLQNGHKVVERARLQKVLDEQNLRISLADTSEKLTSEILKAGKLVGASQVIFAEVQQSVPSGYSTAYRTSVAVRSVHVESGEVRWSGTASYPELTTNPEESAVALAYWAIARADCRVEQGYEWEEPSSRRAGGCLKKQTKPIQEAQHGRRIPPIPLKIKADGLFADGRELRLVFYKAGHLDLERDLPDRIKLAVFNPQAVLEKSNSGRRALDHLKSFAQLRQQELQEMDAKLKTLEGKAKTAAAGTAEKRELETKFRSELEEFQGKAKQFQSEFTDRQKELIDLYMQRVESAVASVAEKKGLDLVLDNYETFSKGKELLPVHVKELLDKGHDDITASVIEEFNRLY